MRSFRRSRTTRVLAVVLIISTLLYILLEYEPVALPALVTVPVQDFYDHHPTYEYTSIYRENADTAFEVTLESKLIFLERALLSNLPEKSNGPIADRTIWQNTSPELADIWSSWVTQWRFNNEDWKHKLYTSPPKEFPPLFETIPEIAAANETYSEIRNDLFRYLLLWYHGGMWSEIDTWNRVSMRNCQPIVSVLKNEKDISLMVGIDVDEPYFSQETIQRRKWSRGFGFGQSTIWAPRRFDPIVRKAIVRTISHAMVQASLQPHNRGIGVETSSRHANEISGPGMFTDIVLEVLSQNLKVEHTLRDRDAGLERRVTWKHFRKLNKVLWITPDQYKESHGENMGGLAVLPIDVWSSGQSHSGSGPSESEDACVNHVHNWRPKKQWKERIFG
jgi:alpha 1,6-mannosyltransferase